MKQLVLKDIRLLGLLNIILLAAGIFTGASNALYGDAESAPLIYALASFIGVYIVLINLANKDIKFNAKPLLLSMPVKRFDIVKARYLTVLLYILSTVGVIALSYTAISIVLKNNKSYFTIYLILFTMAVILLFASVNLILQYIDEKKAQIFNVLLYALVLLSPRIYDRLGLNFLNVALIEKMSQVNIFFLSSLSLVISLFIYGISLFISKFIYEKKEV